MKIIITLFLAIVVTVQADTYYVRYFVDDGAKTAYDKDFPLSSYTLNPDGNTFRGMPDQSRDQKVFSTTNDPATLQNISEFADAVILNPVTLDQSIRKTPEWLAFVASLDAYSPAMDAVTNSIAKVTDAKSKAADQDLKNAIKVLQDEIKALKLVIGKNMRVE